ncbi:MAG TPA: hypothetical protein DCZ95_10335 [Verrucomicrobia bacterium]|nr:MAG: hypothetical protein A2X46_18810 [Lentisphaerae bacterium GWF2_57_35]HBA84480.1 hypothetical protein [Verrucomicrobiota bacterium]
MGWTNILFWIAIVMLVDAAIGLWGANVWQKLAPRFPIQRIALIEAAAALLLLTMYFVLKH